MDNDNYTSAISKDSYPPICYSVGCNNPATTTVKIPLNAIVCCIAHVCNDCLSKYTYVNDDSSGDNDSLVL